MAVTAIDVAIDQEHAAVMILEVFRIQEIHLAGLQFAAVLADLQQGRPGAVARRAKHEFPSTMGVGMLAVPLAILL